MFASLKNLHKRASRTSMLKENCSKPKYRRGNGDKRYLYSTDSLDRQSHLCTKKCFSGFGKNLTNSLVKTAADRNLADRHIIL